MILTSNLAFGSWDGAFGGNAVLTAAMLDRMLHHATIITINAKAIGLRISAKLVWYINLPNQPRNG
jgi:DNA replication protein DnaC